MAAFFFLTSGLFLGWSLGANDAANIFGTAVGSRMLKFRTAAVIAGFFIIFGATRSGAGTVHTINNLGTVNEAAGAFMVALSAGAVVYWMTRLSLPVSTSQAIVGSIVGWNLFSGALTDMVSLGEIVATWIVSPILAAFFSFFLYGFTRFVLRRVNVHLLSIDHYTRIAFVFAGAFGSYALGANNIANVMGVFLSVSPFTPIERGGIYIGSAEQLFFLGGIAIAAGVVSYSYRVMNTVGRDLMKLTPISALVVVFSTGAVLFLFASEGFELFLARRGLPTFPLVPVSSSQAVVGAVIGIALTRGGRGMNFRLVGKIASGWVVTPLLACLVGFISLFFMQNIFNQKVFMPVKYTITPECRQELVRRHKWHPVLEKLQNQVFPSAREFKSALEGQDVALPDGFVAEALSHARLQSVKVEMSELPTRELEMILSDEEINDVRTLQGRSYLHAWMFRRDLSMLSSSWKIKKKTIENKRYNRNVRLRIDFLLEYFTLQKK